MYFMSLYCGGSRVFTYFMSLYFMSLTKDTTPEGLLFS